MATTPIAASLPVTPTPPNPNPSPACALTTCPGVLLSQPHLIGDNECGFLNTGPATDPKPKVTDNPLTCRRPSCAAQFTTETLRLKHETDSTRHRTHDMDFICDWRGHAAAITEAGFCPVCQ